MKPYVHSERCVQKWGGQAADYQAINEMMDCHKSSVATNSGRSLLHHSLGINLIIPKIFGQTITNSDGLNISTAQIAELHVLDDFGGYFIPTFQDYVDLMEYQDWLNNGRGSPPSHAQVLKYRERKLRQST